MSRLFISYRRANWSFTYWLAEELQKLIAADIFVDFTGIDETNFENSLLRNLRESDVILLIVTEHTFASDRIFRPNDWVRREIQLALELGKPMVLALYEGKTPPSDPTQLPVEILSVQQCQGIEFYPRYFKGGVHELASLLDRATPIKLKADAAPAPSQVHVHGNTPKARFDTATTLAEGGDYERALELMLALQAENYQPRFAKLADLISDIQVVQAQEKRRWEAGEAYDEIEMLSRVNKVRAQGAWQQFRQEYPEFTEDPANLARKLATVPPSVGTTLRPPLPVPAKPAHEVYAEVVRQIIGGPFEWCVIPDGPFLFGDDKQEMNLSTYWMAKYPITYRQFQSFLDDPNGFKNAEWWQGLAMQAEHRKAAGDQQWKIDDHPRENVSWYECIAFCRWLSKRVVDAVGADSIRSSMRDASIASLPNYDPMRPATWPIRLPTEAEWEKAARGTGGRIYPWGDAYMAGYANIDETVNNVGPNYLGRTSPVGAYPQGASPYGCLDMAGNVWEWCLSEWTNPYQDQPPAQTRLDNSNRRVLRGGSWDYNQDDARAAFRGLNFPFDRDSRLGFRVCSRSAPI